MAGSLTQMGFAEDFAGLHVELTRALNEGRVTAREARGPENTTATSFEDFAAELLLGLRV